MDITLACLANHPEVIPDLARIWYDVLGGIWRQDVSIKSFEENLSQHMHCNELPITYIAFDAGKLIGGVSLLDSYTIRPDLNHWLGSLVIDSAYQNMGVGSLLVEKVKSKAIELDFDKLHLFVFEPLLINYYFKKGFRQTALDIVSGHVVSIMEAVL